MLVDYDQAKGSAHMIDFCPACKIETDFEISGNNAYCSQCGRTKSAAENASLEQAKKNRSASLRKFLIIFGIALAVFFVLLGFLIEPDRMTDAAFRGIAKATVLFLFFGAIAWIIKKILK